MASRRDAAAVNTSPETWPCAMDEKRTTARAFHDAPGVEDWRVLFSGAHAWFAVGSCAEAARLVAAIAEVAEVVGH